MGIHEKYPIKWKKRKSKKTPVQNFNPAKKYMCNICKTIITLNNEYDKLECPNHKKGTSFCEIITKAEMEEELKVKKCPKSQDEIYSRWDGSSWYYDLST